MTVAIRIWKPMVLFAAAAGLGLACHSLVQWRWLVLMPTVVTIAVVLLARNTIVGLFCGVISGATLLTGHWFESINLILGEHLMSKLTSYPHISLLLFSLMIGGMTHIFENGGGLSELRKLFVSKGAQEERRSTLLFAYFIGLATFLHGVASCILTSRIVLPLTDRVGVSREKLAYVADSTGASVTCIALVSTWTGFQVSILHDTLSAAGVERNAYGVFLATIPMNFYCWFTLALVLAVIFTNLNLGPMAKAEEKAGLVTEESLELVTEPINWRPLMGTVLPVLILLLGLFLGMFFDGLNQSVETSSKWSWEGITTAFQNGRISVVLLPVGGFALLTSFAINVAYFRTSSQSISGCFFDGAKQFLEPIGILLTAWVFSGIIADLKAATFIAQLISREVPLWLLPGCVFIFSGSFAVVTGTSWGTIGLLLPLFVQVALKLIGVEGLDDQFFIVVGVASAVFSGAVFGDHCSPVSDTTLITAAACKLSAFEHVSTQMPYAILAAGLTLIVGFIPLGLGCSPITVLIVGACLIGALANVLSNIKPH